jgi:FKBP-type peptidyl-prolyl cis-trans isomerase 2
MAKSGQKAKVHYRGTFDDGTVFDSSYDRGEPIEFEVGAGQMIPGFDAAVLALEVGDKQTVHILAADAYGVYQEELVQSVPMAAIPNAEQLPVGQFIYLPGEGGQMLRVKVLKLEDGKAFFDLNHEMAGKDLNFEIEVVELV